MNETLRTGISGTAGGMAVAALCALAAGEPEQEAFSLVKFVRSGRVSVPDANI